MENVEWSPVSSAPLAGVVQRGRMAGILSASGSFDHVDGLITYRSLIKRGSLNDKADGILSDSSGMFLTKDAAPHDREREQKIDNVSFR